MAGLSGIAPVIQGLSIVSGLVDTVSGYNDQSEAQDLALKELQQKQQAELRVAKENAALEREKIKLESESAEKERRDALKRATARQRAKFGASGIDTNAGGSAQAVLLGLFEESEEERQEREALDNLRLNALDTDLAQRKRLNVLQQTQLKERQKLSNVSNANSFAQGLLGNANSIISLL